MVLGFHIVNFPNLSSNIPLSPAYGVYISQLVRMARICDNSQKLNRRNKLLTHRLLQQGFEYHRLRRTWKKFCSRYPRLFKKFHSSIKSLIIEGIQLPVIGRNGLTRHKLPFQGSLLIYTLKKIFLVTHNNLAT